MRTVAQSNEAAAAAQRARQASMAKLWEAAKTGDTDAISTMLDAGADPNDPEQAQQPVRPPPPSLLPLARRPDPTQRRRGRRGAARCTWRRRATSPRWSPFSSRTGPTPTPRTPRSAPRSTWLWPATPRTPPSTCWRTARGWTSRTSGAARRWSARGTLRCASCSSPTRSAPAPCPTPAGWALCSSAAQQRIISWMLVAG